MDSTLSKFLARSDIRILLYFFAIIAIVIMLIMIIKRIRTGTKSINARIADAKQALAIYDIQSGRRTAINLAGVDSKDAILTNYYVATAANCALYGPKNGGILSADFIITCIRAGARCLDMAVFPADPLDPRSPPIVCEGNHETRTRTTANWLTFDSVCETIANNALVKNGTSPIGLKGATDPLFIILRIRPGKNRAMLESMATSLQQHFSEYRLPYTYYKCARQDKMYADSVADFMKRVVFISNDRLVGTPLEEYINAVIIPADPSVNALQQTLWTDSQIANLDAPGQEHLKTASQQRLMMVVPAGQQLTLDTAGSLAGTAFGIHFSAVNYWDVNSPTMKAHTLGPDAIFGKSSWVLKPPALRFTPVAVPAPVQPTPQFDANGGILSLPNIA